jgi:hypothetical protein
MSHNIPIHILICIDVNRRETFGWPIKRIKRATYLFFLIIFFCSLSQSAKQLQPKKEKRQIDVLSFVRLLSVSVCSQTIQEKKGKDE